MKDVKVTLLQDCQNAPNNNKPCYVREIKTYFINLSQQVFFLKLIFPCVPVMKGLSPNNQECNILDAS